MTTEQNDRDVLKNDGNGVMGGVEGLEFTGTYLTNFVGEIALAGKGNADIVFHFFPLKNDKGDFVPPTTWGGTATEYWVEFFAQVLDTTAQTFFKAGPDRLKAAYVPELCSWWVRAYGFGTGLDPAGLGSLFMQELDNAVSVRLTPDTTRS